MKRLIGIVMLAVLACVFIGVMAASIGPLKAFAVILSSIAITAFVYTAVNLIAEGD